MELVENGAGGADADAGEAAKGIASPTAASNSTVEDAVSLTDDCKEYQRDPFFAFIPQLAKWGCGLLLNEARTVQRGVTGGPSFLKNFLVGSFAFYRENPRILYKEVVSGFTVAVMQVPESIAFSFVAGVPPLSGLQATWWMAFVTGILGGKPGMISGAAGALAVVVTDLTSSEGALAYLSVDERLDVLFMTMFVCGVFQILFAVFRLAQLVRLIPETGMIGFMNGLAIIIFMAQLPAFQFCTSEPLFIDCTVEQRQWLTFQDQGLELVLVLVHVAVCMVIMQFFPKIPKVGKIIPASLVGLLVGTLLEWTLFRMAIGQGTRTVEETAPIAGAPPKFDWPSNFPKDSQTISTMLSFAIQLAAIGAVESVLTLQACNEITDTVAKISDSNQECFAQGLANLVSGLFRAMGGDAMIGQSTINIMNGARHRVSSTMSGVFMLLFTLVLSPAINLLPIATLTGVLFIVVISTFQWKTFIILRYGRFSDSVAILLVTIVAVFTNLAVAIAAGIILSALVHAWDSGSHVAADVVMKDMIVNGKRVNVKYVHIRGAIFFSSTNKFVNMFRIGEDPDTVILDFKDAIVVDHSAVAAIQGLTHRYALAGKRVIILNIQNKCVGRMRRTHGDHDKFHEQISHHVIDVEGASSADSDEAGVGISVGQVLGTSVKDMRDLPMFKTVSIDGVEKEIEDLGHEGGRYKVEPIEKKNT